MKTMLKNWLKENKVLIILSFCLIIFLLTLWILYALFGHQLIRMVYEARADNVEPLDFYFTLVDKWVNWLLFISFICFYIGIGCFSKQTNRFLNYKNIFGLSSIFIASLIFLHITAKLCSKFIIDIPVYWRPLSIFEPRIARWQQLLVAVIVLVLFRFFIHYLSRVKYKIPAVIFVAIILVLGANLIQGWRGYTNPISSGGQIQYYHEAIKIKNVHFFLSHFEQEQPNLLCHARTHPPGAVLAIYFLFKLLGKASLVSMAIAVISVSLSVFFLYKVLLIEFGDSLSKYVSFLLILIPAVQIYFLASIDALIASFLLAALYFFLHPRPFISIIGSVIFLFLASFLTFLFIFILPIMLGFDILQRKTIRRSLLILLGLGITYFAFYLFFGFNYINSFTVAYIQVSSFWLSIHKTPQGLRLLSSLADSIVTRVERIFELIFFFGPFLCVMTWNGLRILRRSNLQLFRITYLAIFTILAMFISSNFGGETARACLFIYPYFLLPVAAYIEENNFSLADRNVLLHLVFVQSVLMQILGDYFW